MPKKTDLTDILRKKNLLTDEQVSEVKLEHINTGRDVKAILVERGLVKEKELIQAQAELLDIPFIELASVGLSPDILSKIPESVARHYLLLPFIEENGILSVAMKDPMDLQLIEFIETKTGNKVKPFMAQPSEIERMINEGYSVGMEKEVRAALRESEKEVEKVKEQIKDLDKISELVESAPVARIVSTILEYGVKSRASDIHIEPQEDRTRVRYRIDGVMSERLSLPRKVHEAVISRIKILANLKIDEKRVPQDGRFMIEVGAQDVDLRVSTLPTSLGEKVVMRLLRKETKVPSLSELGMRGKALKIFEDALKKTHGIILITGPTGSGKTTTLRTALTKVNTPNVNIITLEDPVEYEISGVNQVQINPVAGLTFASGLRSVVRQDPDIIMVGEIRDSETAGLAIQAALTGHLVFSTLHTNSAAGAIPRLLDMKAEPFLLASTIEVSMAQRLVRTLCQDCKEKYEASEVIMSQLKGTLGPLLKTDTKRITLYKAKGCKACGETGYIGRAGIYEVLPITEKIANLILQKESSDTIEQQAINDGMLKMVQDGFLKVIEGMTTVEEVLRVAQE